MEKPVYEVTDADRKALDEIFYRSIAQGGSGKRDDEPFLQILAAHRLGKFETTS